MRLTDIEPKSQARAVVVLTSLLVLLIAAMGLRAFLAARELRILGEASARVLATMAHSEGVVAAVRELQRTGRGFVIVQDEVFGRRAEQAKQGMWTAYGRLEAAVAERPNLRPKVRAQEPLLRQYEAAHSDMQRLVRTGQEQQAVAYIRSGKGEAASDLIVTTIERFEDSDRLRLDQLAEQQASVARAVAWWLGGGSVVSVASLAAGAVAVRRLLARRRAAEQQFRALVDAAPDAMVVVDQAGHVVLTNQLTESLFGYSAQELIGKPIELLVPQAKRAAHSRVSSAYRAQPRTRPMGEGQDLVGQHRDGHLVPVDISLGAVQGPQGLLVTAAIRDVTEKRRIDREIRDLYDRAPCGYHSLDEDGRIVRVNETEAAWLGSTPKQLIGESFPSFLTPASRALFARRFPVFKQAGQLVDAEFELIGHAGPRTVSVTANVVRDADGRFLHTRSTLVDVTQRARAEAALRDHAEELGDIYRYAPVGYAILDPEGRFLRVNEVLAHWHGYSADELVGRPVRDFLRPADMAEFDSGFPGLLAQGATSGVEFAIADGETRRWVALTANVRRGAADEVVAVRATLVDITERKLAEQERERLIGELREALQTVQTLSGLLPICAWCKKVRDDQGYWTQLEAYISKHSEARFSHGICPVCAARFAAEDSGG